MITEGVSGDCRVGRSRCGKCWDKALAERLSAEAMSAFLMSVAQGQVLSKGRHVAC